MRRRFHSLQVQLAVGLALLYIAVTSIAAGVLVYRAYDTAGSLGDRELSLRAEDLASSISLDAAGNAHLELPHSLARAYATGADADIYAIRSSDGRMLAASPPGFGERVKGWPAPGDDPSYFRLTDFGDRSESYYGLSVAVGSAAGTLWVSVARAGEANALVQSLLWEFVADLAWGIPVLLVVTLAMGVLAIRKGSSRSRRSPKWRLRSAQIRLRSGSPSTICPARSRLSSAPSIEPSIAWNTASPFSASSLRMLLTNCAHHSPSSPGHSNRWPTSRIS
jgi:hypothetical protein